MTDDWRPSGACPICARATSVVDRLPFAPKPHLPDELALEHCPSCNLLFGTGVSQAAYARHYASVQNDALHVAWSDAPDSLDQLQTERLVETLGIGFDGRLLDFGCGQGTLLRRLARRLPRATLHGHDVVDWLPRERRHEFVTTFDPLRTRYDAIVLSHVAEHLVGFDTFDLLARLLAPGGALYVEVPDPFSYRDCPRREFMYYVDRLHLNHFSGRALGTLLARHGLAVRARGTHRFAYRDGHYPAAWTIATGDGAATDTPAEEPLDAVYRDYRRSEAARIRELRERLRARDGVLVYGAGDNFRRARWRDGPLHGVVILAVMDRRAETMTAEGDLHFATPDAALARHVDAPVVVTVSEGGDELAARLRDAWPRREIVVI